MVSSYQYFFYQFIGVMVWLSCSSRRAHGYSDAKSTMPAVLVPTFYLDPYFRVATSLGLLHLSSALFLVLNKSIAAE